MGAQPNLRGQVSLSGITGLDIFGEEKGRSDEDRKPMTENDL